MTHLLLIYADYVHCRIGSLENLHHARRCEDKVHCRIGSLESSRIKVVGVLSVHCRIGSLENKHQGTNQ
ncbi:hypothetical protein VV93_v1c04860 [Vibrio vulnificus]|nr:hypothetical protein VV93_v1c04860 [Vibrio vulnificus]